MKNRFQPFCRFPEKSIISAKQKKNEKDPPRSRKCLNSCHTKDKWIYSYICMWGFFRIVFHPFFYSRNLFTHKIKVFRKGCVENNWKFQLPEDSIAVACHTSKYVATDKRFFWHFLHSMMFDDILILINVRNNPLEKSAREKSRATCVTWLSFNCCNMLCLNSAML